MDISLDRRGKKYIAICDGYWHTGDTLQDALDGLRKLIGKKRVGRVFFNVFFLHEGCEWLPSMPHDGNVDDGFADCWVSPSGQICWASCDRADLGNITF